MRFEKRKFQIIAGLFWVLFSGCFVIFQYWIILFRDIPKIHNILEDISSTDVANLVSGMMISNVMHFSIWVFLYFVSLILLIRLQIKRVDKS